jgi:hypothetical protein
VFAFARGPGLQNAKCSTYAAQERIGRVLDTGLLRKAQARRAAHLVHNVLGFQEDVTENAHADVIIGLHSTEAGPVADRGVVDVLSGNDLLHAADRDAEVGKRRGAREDVAALGAVVLGTGYLGVVGSRDGGVDVHESGAGVEDAGDAGLDGRTAANGVGRCAEAPEALRSVGVDVGDGASVLGAVDIAEVVSAGSMVLEVCAEQRLSELTLHSVEPGGLLHRPDGVDAAHGKTEKAVSVDILSELSRNGGRCLDSLRSRGHGTHGHLVGVHLSRRTGSITVGNPPGVARLSLGRIHLVVVMALQGRLSLERREHPQISAASIEVEVDRVAADGDGAQVRRIKLIAGDSRIGSSVGISRNRGAVLGCCENVVGDGFAVFAECLDHLRWTILAEGTTCHLLYRKGVSLLDGTGNDRAGEDKSRSEVSEGRHIDDRVRLSTKRR